MFVKLGGNIWLVLTAVVVFPAMLYLTRQAPVDVAIHPEQASISQSEKLLAPIQENKQIAPSVAEGSARATPSEKLAKASTFYSDPADSLNISSNTTVDKSVSAPSRREETYQDDNQPSLSPEIYTRESAKPSIQSPAVNTARVNYYSVGNANMAQETATTAVESAAAGVSATTKKQSGSSRAATSQSRVASVDNSILSPLYTAEMQPPPPKIKPKCPPVYMSINAYARNMRIAMGCNDN